MNLQTLGKLDQNAKRLREIVTILGKYGLADWLKGFNYDWVRSWLTSPQGESLGDLTREARVRLALTELGTTFIKLGQILSTRPDLVGPELADELESLQSDTPADSPEVVRATIEAELGKPPEEIFAEFEPSAFASASVAQVHRARLPSGEAVVVKVQHEGIEETIACDFDIISGLAELAEAHAAQLRAYQPAATAAEMRRTLLRELDFTRERRSMEQFTANFAGNERVHFPLAYADYSSRRVLTMEMLDGISLADREALEASGADLNDFAQLGATMYLDMIFRDAFYHADPHPGNLLMLQGGVLGVLDCGMVGRIDDQLRDDFEGMLLAAVNNDADQLTDYVVRLGSVPNDFDRDALRADVGEFLADYAGQSLKDFDLSGALNTMTSIIRRYGIILPSSSSMLLRVLVMLEGTSRQLSPDFSLAELLKPYYAQTLKRRFSPQKLFHRTQRAFRDWERLIDMLPRDLADVLQRVRRGSFEVNLQHRRLEPTVNRLVLGILTAALFMGSAQLWSRGAAPLIGEISLFGALGCAMATLLGVRLLLAIRRSGSIQSDD
jgi:ubiquinone biosynthesis protein